MTTCPNCGLTASQRFGGKVSFALGGALFGAKTMKDPVAVLAFALAGLWLGHQVDKYCPQCGALLQLTAPLWS